MRGVINLRGPVIPLIDLRMKFGLVAESNSRTCVVVLVDSAAGPARSMGLIVNPVDEVTTITPAEIEPIPEFGGPIDRSRLLVLAKVKGQVKTLLSIEQVIKTGRDSAIAPPLPPFRRAANNTPELATKTILAAVGSITLAADAALITPKKSRERSGVDLLCNSIRAPPSSRPSVSARASRSSASASPSTAPRSPRNSGLPATAATPPSTKPFPSSRQGMRPVGPPMRTA